MGTKRDKSQNNQTTSTANTTTNLTETVTDSFNETLNVVTNTTQASPGVPNWLMGAILGGGALVMLFVLALAKR